MQSKEVELRAAFTTVATDQLLTSSVQCQSVCMHGSAGAIYLVLRHSLHLVLSLPFSSHLKYGYDITGSRSWVKTLLNSRNNLESILD